MSRPPRCAPHDPYVIGYLRDNELVFVTWRELAREERGCRCHNPDALLCSNWSAGRREASWVISSTKEEKDEDIQTIAVAKFNTDLRS